MNLFINLKENKDLSKNERILAGYILKHPEDVLKTFQNVYSSLKDNGTFIFDIDSLYKMNVILKNYHEDEEDEEKEE